METLAPVWACDPRDLSDPGEERRSVWESPCVYDVTPPAEMWAEPLSPHLQRNKQLQDALRRREEELVRLQDENIKLRRFFGSSLVRNLQLKAKKLTADGRRQLKRTLLNPEDRLLSSQRVNKRVCRNLTAQFCSQSPETPSEPNLDLWVLRTLGLKDRDTIDPSDASCGFGISTPLYDQAPSEYSLVLGPTLTPQTGSGSGAEHQETDFASPVRSPQSLRGSPGQFSDFAELSGSSPDAAFTLTPNQTQTTSPSPVQTAFWSPLSQTPSQDTVQFSPFSPAACSSPNDPTPQVPCRRTDLAFSMSLSPSSSVKTHSFPQGQAFVRKDGEGRWSFTWVPRHGP